MKHVEISPTMFQCRFYDHHEDNYVASANVFVQGDRGVMFSVTGKGFYEFGPENFEYVCKTMNITSLEGYMTPVHARLCNFKMRRIADVTLGQPKMIYNHRPMIWVTVSLKDRNDYC